MQRSEFTFKGVCSYILYRAMEEGKTIGNIIYESNQLKAENCASVSAILRKIISEGRIATKDTKIESFTDKTRFEIIDK